MNEQSAAVGRLRELLEERTGIYYGDSNLAVLKEHLKTRQEELRLDSLLDYLYYLKWDPNREREWSRLIESVTVNETRFWRESDAIELTVERLLPRLAERERPVRIWHAACSTGEEPYSLAMACLTAGWEPGVGVELLASDIDSAALRRAREGFYRERSVRGLPKSLRQTYLEKREGGYQLSDRVREAVRFFSLNLADSGGLWPRGCGVIFCRNILIYFREPTVVKVALRLWECLRPGGYLVLGASESLLRFGTPFDFHQEEGVILYRKGEIS